MELKKNKKKRYTFTLKEEIIKEFQKQSFEMSESMSSRIEKFMKDELEKDKK